MGYIRVADLDNLWDGEKNSVNVEGKKILILNIGNEIFALEDRCAHKAMALTNGKVEGGTITCPAHEWKYNVRTGEGINPKSAKIVTYPVKVEGKDIYIFLEQP
jgi:toluene monooxygenase system ferredoxin subunit